MLSTDLGDSWLLWLEGTNRYVVLSPAQKAALDLYNAVDGDVVSFHQLLEASLDWSLEQVQEATAMIQALFEHSALASESLSVAPAIPYDKAPCVIFRDFQLGQRHIRVEGRDSKVLNLLWPTLRHLSAHPDGQVDTVFRLLKAKGHLYLYQDGVLLQAVPEQAYHYITGKFLMHLIIEQHQRPESEWIGTLHASTVVRNNQALLLVGQSGQGKSTLSTLLCSAGYRLLADDITPLQAHTLEVGYNPSAVSVKAGAFGIVGAHFPEFQALPEVFLNAFKGKVKYLPLMPPERSSYPCRHLIQVQYRAGAEATLSPISPAEVLEVMIPDSWISAGRAHAAAFMKWLSQKEYYKLTYSDLRDALSLLNPLTPKL